jgi:transposase
VRKIKEEASQRPGTLQISMDCKATVKLGDFSRGGKSRGVEAVKALDHDMATKEKMVPFGILNLDNDEFDVFYGLSYKTSDFICDALELWWKGVRDANKDKDELVIYADNGPESNSHRTQFLLRMVQFARQSGLKIRLVYYPPYHSKYNPIERRWSVLEKHWNGALLNTVSSVLGWTRNLICKFKQTTAHLIEKVYAKGIRLSRAELAEIQPYITRHLELKKWDITIHPEPVLL